MATSGNFAVFQNGDPNDDSVINDGPWTLTFDGTIDLSGVLAPHLEFEQYGARFFTSQEVQVSTDGGSTWTTVASNDDIDPLTLEGGSPYDLPDTRKFNITSAIADDPSNISIRLFWDQADNEGMPNYIDYRWFVDNIRIVEGYFLDADIQTAFFKSGVEGVHERGLTYHKIPTDQITEIEFSAEVINQGALTHENLFLSVQITKDGEELFYSISDSINLVSTGYDSLSTKENYTPDAGVGIYEIVWTFQGDSLDENTLNDTLKKNFEVVSSSSFHSRYARHDNSETGDISNISSNEGEPFVVGAEFEFFEEKFIPSGRFKLASNSLNEGRRVYMTIHKWDTLSNDFIFVDSSESVTISHSEIGDFIEVCFNGIYVEKGDVLLLEAGHYGSFDNGNDVHFALSRSPENGAWAFDKDFNRFPINYIPIVEFGGRSEGDCLGSVPSPVKNQNKFIYPNLATNTIFYHHHQDEFLGGTLYIYNKTGQVFQKWEITQNDTTYEIDISHLAKGSYIIKVFNALGNPIETQQFVKL